MLAHRNNGALISDRTGDTVEYALMGLEERGVLFSDRVFPFTKE